VGEDAGLSGDLVAAAYVVDEMEEGGESGDVVGDGVDADDGVAGARMEAAMPAGSSVGWLGWRRVERRPGSPTVVRNFVTTEILRATRTRS